MRLPRVEDIERRIPAPEDFTSPARGPEATSRVGLALGIAFAIAFLTGVWSHFQYTTPNALPIGPSPASLYRVTQGLHIISGSAAIPLLLVKLWLVYPRLFMRPGKDPTARWLAERQSDDTDGVATDAAEPAAIDSHNASLTPRLLLLDALERTSIAVLMAAAIFQVTSGTLNIVQWYVWDFSFRYTHYAVAWVAIGALLMHIAVKLPIIRAALGAPVERRKPSQDPDAPSRRTVLRGAGVASGLAVLLTAGQSVPFLRKISVFGVRDGDGPQDLPINRTARERGATAAATSPDFVLEVRRGDMAVMLTRSDLSALPQQTHRLPIACVEGWSRSAEWTGVPLRDLIALVDAPPRSAVKVTSMQTKGGFGRSMLPGNFVQDSRTMLALELNGESLSLDHGYPCRIIAPNRPGVLQTKWVRLLEVQA